MPRSAPVQAFVDVFEPLLFVPPEGQPAAVQGATPSSNQRQSTGGSPNNYAELLEHRAQLDHQLAAVMNDIQTRPTREQLAELRNLAQRDFTLSASQIADKPPSPATLPFEPDAASALTEAECIEAFTKYGWFQFKRLRKEKASIEVGNGPPRPFTDDMMWRLYQYRKHFVDLLIAQLHEGEFGGNLIFKSSGSEDIESDLDITVASPHSGNDVKAMRWFNEQIKRTFGKPGGRVFDTNLYARDWNAIEDTMTPAPRTKNTGDHNIAEPQAPAMKRLANIDQDVATLMKQRRYLSGREFALAMQNLQASMVDGPLANARREVGSLADALRARGDALRERDELEEQERHLKQQAGDSLLHPERFSSEAVEELIAQDNKRAARLAELLPHLTKLQSQIEALETQALIQQRFEEGEAAFILTANEKLLKIVRRIDDKLQESPSDTETVETYGHMKNLWERLKHQEEHAPKHERTDVFQQLQNLTEAFLDFCEEEFADEVMEVTDAMYADNMDVLRQDQEEIDKLEHPLDRCAEVHPDQDHPTWYLQSGLDGRKARVKRVQFTNIVFANEAYVSQGAITHIVAGKQAKDPARKQQVLDALEPALLMQSANEQLADFYKDMKHMAHEEAKAALGAEKRRAAGEAFVHASKYLERMLDAVGMLESKYANNRGNLDILTNPPFTICGAMGVSGLKQRVETMLLALRKSSTLPGNVKSEIAFDEVGRLFGVDSIAGLKNVVMNFGVEFNARVRKLEETRASQAVDRNAERAYFTLSPEEQERNKQLAGVGTPAPVDAAGDANRR
jgi:hypothetical protein